MIVTDASVIFEVLRRTGDGMRLERRILGGEPLHALHLLDIEVAQVLRRFEARGEVDASQGRRALDVLAQMPIERHSHNHLLPRVWTLRSNLTAYDAAYVALAEALDATLLTRDERLAGAPGVRARIELV